MPPAIALAALLLAQAAPPVAPPPAAPPQVSAETWTLDQLRVPASIPLERLKAIEPDHSLAAVEATLRRLKIPFARQRVSLSAAQLPAEVVSQINTLPAGEPFLLPSPDYHLIMVVVGRTLPARSTRRALPALRQQA